MIEWSWSGEGGEKTGDSRELFFKGILFIQIGDWEDVYGCKKNGDLIRVRVNSLLAIKKTDKERLIGGGGVCFVFSSGAFIKASAWGLASHSTQEQVLLIWVQESCVAGQKSCHAVPN